MADNSEKKEASGVAPMTSASADAATSSSSSGSEPKAPEAKKELPPWNIVVLAKSANSMKGAITFLSRRDIQARVATTFNEAMEAVAKKSCNLLMISMNFPHPKIETLPNLFLTSFNMDVMIFAETEDRKTTARLNNTKAKYVLSGPASGPAIAMKLRQIEKAHMGEGEETTDNKRKNRTGTTEKDEQGNIVLSSKGNKKDDNSIVLKDAKKQKGFSDDDPGLEDYLNEEEDELKESRTRKANLEPAYKGGEGGSLWDKLKNMASDVTGSESNTSDDENSSTSDKNGEFADSSDSEAKRSREKKSSDRRRAKVDDSNSSPPESGEENAIWSKLKEIATGSSDNDNGNSEDKADENGSPKSGRDHKSNKTRDDNTKENGEASDSYSKNSSDSNSRDADSTRANGSSKYHGLSESEREAAEDAEDDAESDPVKRAEKKRQRALERSARTQKGSLQFNPAHGGNDSSGRESSESASNSNNSGSSAGPNSAQDRDSENSDAVFNDPIFNAPSTGQSGEEGPPDQTAKNNEKQKRERERAEARTRALARGAQPTEIPEVESDTTPLLWRCLHSSLNTLCGESLDFVDTLNFSGTAFLVTLKSGTGAGSFLVTAAMPEPEFRELVQNLLGELRKNLNENGRPTDVSEFAVKTYMVSDFSELAKLAPPLLSAYGSPSVPTLSFFLETADLNYPEFATTGEMCELPLDNLPIEAPVPFEVFLHFPINKKYVRYLKEGARLSQEQKQNLGKSAVNTVYLPSRDVEIYRRFYLHQRLLELLPDLFDLHMNRTEKKTEKKAA